MTTTYSHWANTNIRYVIYFPVEILRNSNNSEKSLEPIKELEMEVQMQHK
jgi:hypothetical protein